MCVCVCDAARWMLCVYAVFIQHCLVREDKRKRKGESIPVDIEAHSGSCCIIILQCKQHSSETKKNVIIESVYSWKIF